MRGDQLIRQWKILQIVESSRMGVSAPQLPEWVEVSVETIYRDMRVLSLAGFPFRDMQHSLMSSRVN